MKLLAVITAAIVAAPLCLGGDNGSPLNQRPQSSPAKKDWLEARICAKVCLNRNDNELHRYQATVMPPKDVPGDEVPNRRNPA